MGHKVSPSRRRYISPSCRPQMLLWPQCPGALPQASHEVAANVVWLPAEGVRRWAGSHTTLPCRREMCSGDISPGITGWHAIPITRVIPASHKNRTTNPDAGTLCATTWSGRHAVCPANTQKTGGLDPMLFQCWTSAVGGGPTLKQHWANSSQGYTDTH